MVISGMPTLDKAWTEIDHRLPALEVWVVN
jgi:hypothetical protein